MGELITYTNPSTVRSIGDPFVLKAPDGSYYCYPTSGPGFKVWRSLDFNEWKYLGIAYNHTQDGNWADGKFWAPEIVHHNGKYYMYYTGNWIEKQSIRIGIAVSEKPEGPFTELLKRPLFDFDYAVTDPHVFIDDDGNSYIYYVRDCSENIVNGIHESHIYGARLSDTMTELTGEPVLLTWPEQEWEKRSGLQWRRNEGPFMIKMNDMYYLMYSGNYVGDKSYSIGYAVADNPLGPFTKYAENPILEAFDEWNHVSGPGHHSLFLSPDETEIFVSYHTHMDPKRSGGAKQMAIDRLGFREDGSIYINGPSLSPMPLPSGTAELYNLAPNARIAVSSGRNMHTALIDGEIGFNKRFGRYDWVADSGDISPEITLSWERPVTLHKVMVYRGCPYTGNPFELTVSIRGKNENYISFPEIPGAAAIFDMNGIQTSSCTMKLKGAGEFRLSEIVVLGSMQ